MLVSIIVRSFNEEKHIGRLLKGIQEQDVPYEKEVILVDSGSTDRTVEIAKKFGVRLITIRPEEFSFGYSLNIGIQHAAGDYCVFISAHCYPDKEGWLAHLINPFQKNDDIAIAYGCQRGNEVTKFSEHQVFKKWFPNESIIQKELPFCNNANSAIRRELWEEYHFDEELTGLEDLDWAKTMVKKGYKIAYIAQATVIHVHEETPQQVFKRYEREAIAIKKIFPENTFNFLDFIYLLILNVISDFSHAIEEGVFFKKCNEILIFRFYQFWGTYKGYNLGEPLSKDLKYKLYYPLNPGISRKSNANISPKNNLNSTSINEKKHSGVN